MSYTADPRPAALVKAKVGKVSGVSAGALAIACALIAASEGIRTTPYVDKLGTGQPLTVCYGSTVDVIPGKTYTRAECQAMLLRDARSHAQEVQRYLPSGLPDKTAAAFYDFGYNVGAETFRKSSVSRKALAGDLVGACRAIGLYVFTNGKDCRVKANRCGGIVTRRNDEVALCLSGLK